MVLKKWLIIGSLIVAVAAGLLFPGLAWAPHIKKGESAKKTESSYKVKTAQVVYIKCPHCGKTIKLHINASR